jgi:pectin methylesterase-like acyl-CoA thioesterase
VSSAGTPINVPKGFPTIQAAVDAAPSGATIHIAPGAYSQQIVIGKDLNLRGQARTRP